MKCQNFVISVIYFLRNMQFPFKEPLCGRNKMDSIFEISTANNIIISIKIETISKN